MQLLPQPDDHAHTDAHEPPTERGLDRAVGKRSVGPADPPRVFSVGHSNHSMEEFLELLRQFSIEVLVDTRSVPRSRIVPHFDAQRLRRAVEAEGVSYAWLGNALGGRPRGREFYDAAGHVLYGEVARTPRFVRAVERIVRGARKRTRVALLCSEENPIFCHRRLLVGRVLESRGVEVLHIRRGGRLQTERELLREEERRGTKIRQPSFFEDTREWKSIQSVLQRRPPKSSSAD